ncbi:hypothetical protein TWF481_008481 [Arthrobotrys musiformis]|uniref:J domain-containing protein n=1 Tax=Arthrobotrys musiformis TaxID=47236 RepID=A0AAV9W8A7_9PEZI
MKNHYELLGIPAAATQDEVKQAYKRAALKTHPDKNRGSEHANEAFKEVQAAYECLSDPTKRTEYDRIHKPAPPPPPSKPQAPPARNTPAGNNPDGNPSAGGPSSSRPSATNNSNGTSGTSSSKPSATNNPNSKSTGSASSSKPSATGNTPTGGPSASKPSTGNTSRGKPFSFAGSAPRSKPSTTSNASASGPSTSRQFTGNNPSSKPFTSSNPFSGSPPTGKQYTGNNPSSKPSTTTDPPDGRPPPSRPFARNSYTREHNTARRWAWEYPKRNASGGTSYSKPSTSNASGGKPSTTSNPYPSFSKHYTGRTSAGTSGNYSEKPSTDGEPPDSDPFAPHDGPRAGKPFAGNPYGRKQQSTDNPPPSPGPGDTPKPSPPQKPFVPSGGPYARKHPYNSSYSYIYHDHGKQSTRNPPPPRRPGDTPEPSPPQNPLSSEDEIPDRAPNDSTNRPTPEDIRQAALAEKWKDHNLQRPIMEKNKMLYQASQRKIEDLEIEISNIRKEMEEREREFKQRCKPVWVGLRRHVYVPPKEELEKHKKMDRESEDRIFHLDTCLEEEEIELDKIGSYRQQWVAWGRQEAIRKRELSSPRYMYRDRRRRGST